MLLFPVRFLFLVQKTDLDESIDLLFYTEGASQDRVLEELARLIDLVCLGKNCAELVEHLRLLVEVG